MKSTIIRRYGAPDVLEFIDSNIGPPGSNEILIRQSAIGVNFHDVYVRSGFYSTLTLPGIPGIEAVGIVEYVGDDVKGWIPGDRIVYVSGNYGAYTSHRLLVQRLALRLPDSIADEVAAALFVRGLTVEMLTSQLLQVTAGQNVLIHSAAGTVGSLLARRCAQKGASVIGTVSRTEKIQRAKESGCRAVYLYSDPEVSASIREITGGRGIDIVFDSVGRETIDISFECLRSLGHLIIFGQSSGLVPDIEVARLAKKSLTVSRPILFDFLKERERHTAMAESVFSSIIAHEITAPIIKHFALSNADLAHELIEDRTNDSAIVLIP